MSARVPEIGYKVLEVKTSMKFSKKGRQFGKLVGISISCLILPLLYLLFLHRNIIIYLFISII